MRVTEQYWPGIPTLEQLITADADAKYEIPIDSMTDCRDLYELVTGLKGVPQDRSQRLIVMSIREKRLIRKVRSVIWCDTCDMLANSLTKHSTTERVWYRFLETGHIEMSNKNMLAATRCQPQRNYTESDLEQMSH